MKSFALILLCAVSLFLAGCGDDAKKVALAASDTVTAPVNYLGAAVSAQKQAEKVIDVSYLNQAIQMFNVQEGRLPQTLTKLVPNYIAKIPEAPFGLKIIYDAAAGAVKVVKQ